MPPELTDIFNWNLEFESVLSNLIVALLCGLAISFLYRKIYSGPGYQASFVNGLVVLALITAVVIMVIGNNLARAFGLVGAMSIIRFRTAVKDTQDITFIFFSLAMGMAAGVGLHNVAITGTIFIALVLYVLTKSNVAAPMKKEFLLQFNISANGVRPEEEYLPVLKRYCRDTKLINVKSIGADEALELSFYVKMKNSEKNTDLVREIKTIDGVKQVNLFYDEEYF